MADSKILDDWNTILLKPELYLSNYFYSIQNEIDIKCEELILANRTNQSLVDQLNSQREQLLSSLKLHQSDLTEKYLLNRLKIDTFFSSVHADQQQRSHTDKDSASSMREGLRKLERILLHNRTFIFNRTDGAAASVGHLLVIDATFNSAEIELIKQIDTEILTANLNQHQQRDQQPLNLVDFRFTSLMNKLRGDLKESCTMTNKISYSLLIIQLIVAKYLLETIKEQKNNLITTIHIDRKTIRKHLNETVELEYAHSDITSIDVDPFCFINDLEHFYDNLNFNDARSTSSMFDSMQNLALIYLSDNKIERLESKMFYGLGKLKSLIMDKNQLSGLDAPNFEAFDELEELNLCSNEISELESATFARLSHLKRLDLSENQLKSLHENLFENQRLLEELSIGSNNFKCLSSSNFIFRNLQSLTYLYLSDNYIEKLDSESLFASLYNLEVLSLSYNRISLIHPNAFANLRTLKELYLQTNQLKTLNSDWFNGLNELRILMISENKITELQSNVFLDLLALETLDLSENQLEVIADGAFKNQSKLNSLSLRKNALKTLSSDTFVGLSNLKSLDLSNNKLELLNLQTQTSSTSNLSTSKSASSLFRPLLNLYQLNLSNNFLQWFEPTDYASLLKLKTLILFNNVFDETEIKPEIDRLREMLKDLEKINFARNVM